MQQRLKIEKGNMTCEEVFWRPFFSENLWPWPEKKQSPWALILGLGVTWYVKSYPEWGNYKCVTPPLKWRCSGRYSRGYSSSWKFRMFTISSLQAAWFITDPVWCLRKLLPPHSWCLVPWHAAECTPHRVHQFQLKPADFVGSEEEVTAIIISYKHRISYTRLPSTQRGKKTGY